MSPDRRYHGEQQNRRDWAWNPRWTSEPPFLPHIELTPSPGSDHTPLSKCTLLGGSEFHNSPPDSYAETQGSRFEGNWQRIQRSTSMSTLDTSAPTSVPQKNEISAGPPPLPKHIRFVSNDGQPHIKRRRITAACQTCRKRKTKCTGERPECRTCLENGHDCLGYTENSHQSSHEPKSSSENQAPRESNEDESSSLSPSKSESGQLSISERRKHHKYSQPEPAHLQHQDSGESSGCVTGAASSMRDRDFDQTVDKKSPASNNTSVSINTARNRVPYFRYFGPTAIVPGFKQMVVQMKQRHSTTSLTGESPASNPGVGNSNANFGMTPSTTHADTRPPVDIPFYDATDPLPNNPLIPHLCETFFTHLGCNYPFLQRERFLHDLEEKRVDAILVDAVCAVAARFSAHPLLSLPTSSTVLVDAEHEVLKAFRGHPFAQRAMAAVADTFPCPTMAVTQACLLLAYEEFGSDHDSGLWMYLGTSIRMAQDLGMQKLEGMQLEGRIGPTPKTTKKGPDGKAEERKREQQQKKLSAASKLLDGASLEDRRASEQERIDTFYCIFFLDRVVSSGTGRPVTLRDKDIEISFPYKPNDQNHDGWPQPFSPLIRIVHLYGRVTDILNNINEANQVTPDTMKRLAGMEKDLTGIYQRLSPKLHFNATNFQHYVKAGQGTNFILLHFWFHTLIVLLHQPTLLHSFEGRIQQLFPDSRELSMSSAKTIADILAFAELIDAKSFIGNPFTSQPMYIAACAFLMEAAAHASHPPSRASTPPHASPTARQGLETEDSTQIQLASEQKMTAKYTLLATAANQNYQRCYKALKSLETYWAGTRYILTVLDQKAKGITNPLLFTSDDLDSEMPSTEPDFSTPGWRRSTPHGVSLGATATGTFSHLRGALDGSKSIWTSNVDPSQAIGWSLTGTTNSPNPNLSFLYQTSSEELNGPLSPQGPDPSHYNPVLANLPLETAAATAKDAINTKTVATPKGSPKSLAWSYVSASRFSSADQASSPYCIDLDHMSPPMTPKMSTMPSKPVSTVQADLLPALHGPFGVDSSPNILDQHNNLDGSLPPSQPTAGPYPQQAFNYSLPIPSQAFQMRNAVNASAPGGNISAPFNDKMMIESQDIVMSASEGAFTLPGGDMVHWLEWLPPDILSYFGDPPENGSMVDPAGPGPPPPPPPNRG